MVKAVSWRERLFSDMGGNRKVSTRSADKATQSRFSKAGCSYASSPDRRLFFGLGGQEKITKLTVSWPDGTTQEFTDVPVDRYCVLKKGEKVLLPATAVTLVGAEVSQPLAGAEALVVIR